MSEMLNNVSTNVERIVAKIDNDFNPDNSDWIPRVGAWCIDAMAQLKVFNTELKRKKYAVIDKIVRTECPISNKKFKIYDSKGCEIKQANSKQCPCSVPSTGDLTQSNIVQTSTDTTSIYNNDKNIPPEYVIGETINSDNPYDVTVRNYNFSTTKQENDYVIVDKNTIEFKYDIDNVIIEQETVKTEYSEAFDCELPVIPNNGLLIEAITYYCMYKMLCRGYKHPVFNLNASQYGTNPYYIWINMKESARRSVIIDGINEDSSKLFRSNMFINMFDSRG